MLTLHADAAPWLTLAVTDDEVPEIAWRAVARRDVSLLTWAVVGRGEGACVRTRQLASAGLHGRYVGAATSAHARARSTHGPHVLARTVEAQQCSAVAAAVTHICACHAKPETHQGAQVADVLRQSGYLVVLQLQHWGWRARGGE